jgi:hypothetical protein
MTNKIILITVILLLTFSFSLYSQEFAPVGTATAQFLEVGMGARGTAMGEAYTVLTKDAGSVFWNPAGILSVERSNFFMAYNKWPADISFGGLSYALNLGDNQAIGISAVFLSTDDMVVTTVDDPEGTSGLKFGITNYSLGLTYGRKLTNRLSLALTTKLVRENYMEYGYTSWALDVGTIYETGYHGLKLGMSILNFGPEIQFSGAYNDYSDPDVSVTETKPFEKYSMPINFRFGVSLDVWESGKNKVISAFDMVHPNNNLEQYNLGMEYGFDQLLFIRGGYKFQLDEGGLTLGAGARYKVFGEEYTSVDYSFAEVGILPSVHRLSVSISF